MKKEMKLPKPVETYIRAINVLTIRVCEISEQDDH
jgi:hypothetical protein